MKWLDHSNLKNRHAPLSPSQPSWFRADYSQDQLKRKFVSEYITAAGTSIHAIAEKYISSKVKITKYMKMSIQVDMDAAGIPRSIINADDIFINLQNYVNDAVGFRMDPEVKLYYSDSIFGTADAISYNNGVLRIHDLKTGRGPVHMEQLLIYAALFCLEYMVNPKDISVELRIYQNDEVNVYAPTYEELRNAVDRIVYCDNEFAKFKEELQ